MSNIEKIRQKIERLYDGEVPSHDQQCDFGDGYFEGLATILNFIDSLPEEKPSRDLEEAAEIYCHDMGLDAEDNGTAWEETKDDFIAGAKWMKERMIKDAAEVITVQRSLTEPEFVKQRVIFLKEG